VSNKHLKSAIVFDFDGTLVDNLLVSLQIIYQLVHHKPMPHEDISRLRGMTLLQVLRQLGVAPWQAILLRGKVYRAMSDRSLEIVLVPGIANTLRRLAKDHQLFILSSNSPQNIHAVLKRFELDQFIVAVSGGANPLLKRRKLKQLARQYHLKPRSTWYVGDQIWDIQAAKRAGMHSAAVAWGFSNLHVLELAHPEYLAFTPEELLKRLR